MGNPNMLEIELRKVKDKLDGSVESLQGSLSKAWDEAPARWSERKTIIQREFRSMFGALQLCDKYAFSSIFHPFESFLSISKLFQSFSSILKLSLQSAISAIALFLRRVLRRLEDEASNIIDEGRPM